MVCAQTRLLNCCRLLYKYTDQQEFAMRHIYRQNYIPSRPLPRWLQRLISWL
jgi:hypothetical protein